MSLQMTLLRAENGTVPTFEQTLHALGSIPAILYRALEFGTGQNRTFFETLSEGERPRSHIREMIVRDQAKRFLERNQFQVDDEAVSIGNEPLAALVIRCGPVQIRVLKGFDGTIPGCGESSRRRDFYNQTPVRYQNARGQLTRTRLNLVLLWDFDSTFNLAKLWLACPMRAGDKPTEVLLHWQEPIEHPATAPSVQVVTPETRKAAEQELEKLLSEDKEEDTEEGAREA